VIAGCAARAARLVLRGDSFAEASFLLVELAAPGTRLG
jgi:hypothetical protein